MFFTYIIYSPSLDKFYVGQTDNLHRRIQEHRVDHLSRFTSRADDWEYVFYQSTPNRADAVRLEDAVKKRKSRKSIYRFIADPRNECPNTGSASRPPP